MSEHAERRRKNLQQVEGGDAVQVARTREFNSGTPMRSWRRQMAPAGVSSGGSSDSSNEENFSVPKTRIEYWYRNPRSSKKHHVRTETLDHEPKQALKLDHPDGVVFPLRRRSR